MPVSFDPVRIQHLRSKGIFPDPMHLIDLSTTPDLAISVLLDWTDSREFIDLPNRTQRLERLRDVYKNWVGSNSDRANPKLFSVEVLKPRATRFASISQHYLSAAAARGFLVWLSIVASHFAAESPTRENL